jgi:hypothetical protein
MATLTDDVKAFIVQALACFDTPSQVADAVKAEYGIIVTRQQCEAYDPNKKIGKGLSAKWKALSEETRKRFLEDASQIPIANQTFRLRTLDRMLQRVEKQGNLALAAQLLEQASKEVGGAFTNKRELTGKDGAPIQTESKATLDVSGLTAEQLRAIASIKLNG